MIKIEPISGGERADFAVCAELEQPTVLLLKVMEHSASWPEYEILELPVGKSRTVIDYFDIDDVNQIKYFEFPYNPAAVAKAKSSDGKGGHLVTDGDGKKHLPTKTNGAVNRRLMGAAHAALTGGYRGKKYEGPDKEKALGKLKRMYVREGMKWPSEK